MGIVEEVDVAVLVPVVQSQSMAAGASETGLPMARPTRRATQRVTAPMGESLMVAVVNEVGRNGRGSRDVLGRRKTKEDRSRARLARLLLEGRRGTWFGEKVGGFYIRWKRS